MSPRLSPLLLAGLFLPNALAADAGGKWLPEQLSQHDPTWLRQIGLELPAATLWDPEKGGGLLEAVAQITGCSSGFVSPDGLLVTNHHCIFSILQEHSTPERDLIQDGFLAKRREDELPASTTRVQVPIRFVDVTAEILQVANAAKDDLARYHAIDRKRKEMIAACEATPGRRCQVAIYDDGSRYQLIEALEFRDVRLVYAPPRGVGEYGGEIDNWMWPRHTGDFALVRVYAQDGSTPAPHAAANVPYRNKRHFRISTEGVHDGSFVLIAGYPGRTFRSLIAAEVAEREELFYPARAELYRRWIDLMEELGRGDEAASIALADRVKSLSNREKNSRGQIEGMRRGGLTGKKKAEETALLLWAESSPEHRQAVAAYRELEQLEAEARKTWTRDFLLSQARSGSRPLAWALTLTRWAIEKEKPDVEREVEYQERNRERLRLDIDREQKRFHRETEDRLLADYFVRLAGLPTGQRVAALDAFLDSERSAAGIAARTRALHDASRVLDLAARQAMFDETAATLRSRKDPLLDLAFALNQEIIALENRDRAREGAISRLRPLWRRAVTASATGPVEHDANSTLRVSLSHVRGYVPRDGVIYTPKTSLAGLLDKHTGQAPFDAPAALLAQAAGAAKTRWADPELGDLAINFLSTSDTTGGSSGSPVLNGKGELVGVNFDRVWENVANDFGWTPEIARGISVDIRYMLWLLEATVGADAQPLLRELGIPPER